MLGLVGALLLSVGLGSATAPPPALPTIQAPAPASSLAAVSADAFAHSSADPHLAGPYFGARYYSSRIARFTTVDPVYTWNDNLLDPQRWNRYAYGLNNPLRNVDPDGSVLVPAIIAGAYVAYEFPSQAYDAYTLGTTLADPNATAGEKAAATGGFVIGAVAPGGGYGTAGKAAVGKGDDVARALKRGRESEARVLDALGEAKKHCEGQGMRRVLDSGLPERDDDRGDQGHPESNEHTTAPNPTGSCQELRSRTRRCYWREDASQRNGRCGQHCQASGRSRPEVI